MIHLMLGSTFEVAIRNLMGYVLSYEDKDLSDVFTGMLCTRDDDGKLIFKIANQIRLEESKDPKFNSEPDESFGVELIDDAVVEDKDQFDHLKSYFSRLFDKRVTINSKTKEAVLNICLYLPMYDADMWRLAKLLIKAISGQNRNINVDLFMFSSDLAYLFTPAEEQASLPTKVMAYERMGHTILKDAVDFKEKSQEARKLGHIIVMQNCNASGLSLDLDWNSFVRVIGEFTIASMNSYYDILQPNAEIEGRPIHSFGLCVLNLDKCYYVRYLLRRAYVTVLEREGINQNDIDVNGPSQTVQKALIGDGNRYKFYDAFYEHRVRGYIADGKSEDDINAQATKDIDGDIEKLICNVTAFLNDETISLPEKRVTLAQLLGMDDEMMTGDMFNPEQLLFRDTYADCIDMFVNANNALLQKQPSNLYVDIPAQEEGEIKRELYPESFKTFAVLSEEEIDFARMRRELKEDEVKIRRQTEYIRTLQKDLTDCKVQEKQSVEKDKVLTKDGFKYGDRIYKFLPVETIPLENTYVPKRATLPKSVDLRKNFTYVKDQGSAGSCTSFALTSIFEYILGKNQKFDADLSERYLYYTTRVEALKRMGKPEESVDDVGSCLFDACKSLQVNGICKEDLCPYDESQGINEKPSDQAYADGRTRLVTEALNVNLTENDLKSALNEGYPIAIAMRIFSNFSETAVDHGFVSLPDEDEVRKADEENIETGHAMVICGYSDENKVFVVRNSWGVGFGEKGYCYVPYSYVTDSHLTDQACIITGINLVTSDQVKDSVSHEVVPFDKLNPEINAAIIKILIGEASREKADLTRHRTTIYAQYSLLEKKLVNSEVRSTLTSGTKERLKWEISELNNQKSVNKDCEDRRLKLLDKENRKINISFFAALGVMIVAGIILGRTSLFRVVFRVIPITKIFLILLAFGVLAMLVWWIVYLKNRKIVHREHAEVDEALEELIDARTTGGSNNAGHLGLYSKAIGIRMFIPWLVIRKLSEKNRLLEQKYQVMVNYTKNLKEWYNTEKAKVGSLCPETRDPFISLLSNETLDKFYTRHSGEITAGVSLSSLFKSDYSVSDSAIIKFQNDLKNRIIQVLDDSLKDFSVYRYLTGKTNFEFAKAREFDIHEMLTSLEHKSEIFIRLGLSPVTNESINATTTVLMSSDIEDNINTWNDEFQRDFSVPVQHIRISSPFKLSFLQMKRLPIEECLDLYDPKALKWKDTPFGEAVDGTGIES